MAFNSKVDPFKRPFASGAPFMTYTRLRFSGVQRLRGLYVNKASAHVTPIRSKTKRHHGLSWPWASHQMGFLGSKEWSAPLIDLRNAREKQTGSMPSLVFRQLSHCWGLERAKSAPYFTTRRKLALIFTGLSDPGRETYTLHPQKNFLPTTATQMNLPDRNRNVIWHLPSNSRKNERYGRIACAGE